MKKQGNSYISSKSWYNFGWTLQNYSTNFRFVSVQWLSKISCEEEKRKGVKMRPHLVSANCCLLRQALPVLFQPYNSILLLPRTTAPMLLKKSFTAPRSPHFLFQNTFSSRFARNLCARATDVNDAGSIDLPLMQSMEKKVLFIYIFCFLVIIKFLLTNS